MVDDSEIETLIWRLMNTACRVSNIGKPWSDNCYGRVASALCWCLSTDHSLHPTEERPYPLSDHFTHSFPARPVDTAWAEKVWGSRIHRRKSTVV